MVYIKIFQRCKGNTGLTVMTLPHLHANVWQTLLTEHTGVQECMSAVNIDNLTAGSLVMLMNMNHHCLNPAQIEIRQNLILHMNSL